MYSFYYVATGLKDADFVFSHTEFEVPVGQPGGDAQ